MEGRKELATRTIVFKSIHRAVLESLYDVRKHGHPGLFILFPVEYGETPKMRRSPEKHMVIARRTGRA